MKRHRHLLILLAVAATALTARGGDEAVQPTVTAEDGDRGGRYFGQPPDPRHTHHYYVAAETTDWNFAPSGRDDVCGLVLPPGVAAAPAAAKIRYVQYTDASFQSRVFAPESLGILGPVLRGVVGDYIVVTFLNRTGMPLSMHPHGVRYDKDSEGAYYRPAPGRGAAVGPSARFTYVWYLDANAGPSPQEPSSKAWLYHSHTGGDTDTNLGLVGFIIVTDPRRARPDGTPADVDRELGALFMIFDESGLGEDQKEAAEYATLPGAAPAPKTWAEIQQQLQQGARYAINGRVFGNLRGLEANEGERVRWYLFGLGSETDFHTAHWHGQRVTTDARSTDVVELLPGSMKVADMVANNPGDWLFHCHVAEHMREGMFTRLTVYARDTVGVSRTPADAFLGLPAAAQSIRIDAVTRTPRGDTAGQPHTVRLQGALTVYDAFAVFSQPWRVEIGGAVLTLKPNSNGFAENADGDLRITNAGQTGVIYGGVLEFELTLRGAAAREFSAEAGRGMAPLPLVVSIGSARHATSIGLTSER